MFLACEKMALLSFQIKINNTFAQFKNIYVGDDNAQCCTSCRKWEEMKQQ